MKLRARVNIVHILRNNMPTATANTTPPCPSYGDGPFDNSYITYYGCNMDIKCSCKIPDSREFCRFLFLEDKFTKTPGSCLSAMQEIAALFFGVSRQTEATFDKRIPNHLQESIAIGTGRDLVEKL
jgi:hypothetical protein